ncbi:glucoamylase family protein [Hydrogenophaga sp.]|uniref:GH36-type glycosyl hydrolase domain-containing protein n=1 Tax=Hydrogenophaga sp. TaxID=1904254 RepID=UPI0025BBCE24|nr:glucoamylase family protein [Hydrogenophaga sp.]
MADARGLGRWSWVPNRLERVLDASNGPALEPIRSELFGRTRFEQHGRSLGTSHRADLARFGRATFYPRLQNNVRTLRSAYEFIALASHDWQEVSPAAEWLLDNFHLIEAQLREIREGLPLSYYRTLPVLQDAPLVGLPRIYGVAWAFVAHTDSAFDETLLVQFLNAYQDARELTQGELWALPTTLRVVLVENLRRLADRIASHKAARELASLCASRIDTLPLGDLVTMRELMVRRRAGEVFVLQLAQSLAGHAQVAGDTPLARARDWLQQEVPDLATLQAQQHAAQAADHLSVGNAITALRLIGAADWADAVAHTSRVVRAMLGSSVFQAEDDASRNTTLHGIERLSAQSGKGEALVAQRLLQLMSEGSGHSALASHWLQGDGRAALEQALGLKRRRAGLWRPAPGLSRTAAYLGAMLLGSLLLVAWLLYRPGWLAASWPTQLGTVLVGLLMLLPASEAVVALVNRLISESVKPSHLPRLLLPDGIPPEARVMVVVPAMLSHRDSISQLVHRLQLHHLANTEACAQFALLSDWTDADTEHHADDDSLLSHAQAQLAALNARYPEAPGQPPRFLLLHRGRSASATQRRWLGWERKRGKLEQLVAALATGTPGPFFDLGEVSRMAPNTRYILTLDSDTQLPPGRLRALVGVAEHPNNRPQLDSVDQRVVRGYGILQPRVVPPLAGDGPRSLWQWLFDGQRGIDPYSAMSSDVYQDLFGEGSFTGKGLLHVATLHAVLGDRLPSDQVLSHDLLEGALVRCAVVTDVTLIEPDPTHADAAAARLHRWARGDWQLLPFLLRHRHWPLGAINRWKLLDNLRRSLVAPASLLLIGLAMLGLGVSLPVALGLTLAAYSAGPLLGALAACVPGHWRLLGARFFVAGSLDLLRAVGGGFWHLALLQQQALMSLDAVLRTLHRLAVSRLHLLEWTTAEAAQAGLATRLPATLGRHRIEPVGALLWLVGLWLLTPPAPGALTLTVLVLWALAPLLVWASNTPWPSRSKALRPADRVLLDGVARDTWRLFERCVNPQNHHLPPDNLQLFPYEIEAHRTSPTNIGLYLLSAACARRFGWIGTQDLLARLDATCTTLQQMERHRGHFLNWYDTETLQPLPPRYVSTVDSGNLSAHLLTVAQACRELAQDPHEASANLQAIARSRERLQPHLPLLQSVLHQPLHQTALGQLLDATPPESVDATACAAFLALLLQAQAELEGLQPARNPAIVSHPTTPKDELRWLLADHLATLRSGGLDVAARGAGSCERTQQRLQAAAEQLEAMAWEADFHFLYHPKRHLLHIGYRVDHQQLDTSFYDLLASESRTTSLLAIAKGELPVRHWAALGRPFFASGRRAVLRSWSGSMFEYLMPTLVVQPPRDSALFEAGRSALREQIAFVRGSAMPWGISESAYAGQDHTLAYQYAPQGVPRLAMRRTPAAEQVIAPYATALATQVDAALACNNLRALSALSARGRYGFIEALDFTQARQIHGEPFTLVNTFMAHHQGMSIVALANVLCGGVAQRWGMSHPRIEAVCSLLHERAPRELPALHRLQTQPLPALPRHASEHVRMLTPGAQALEPTHLLSNGRYSVTLRSHGAGWSRWGQTGITRWRDDAMRDASGAFIYLRLGGSGAAVSVTRHPAPDPDASYQCRFHTDRVCFDATWPELKVTTTVWVSPEDDIELRKVLLVNRSSEAIELELISALDITLASHAADEAHPAFSNLFVKTDWLPEQQALRCVRTPRLQTEGTLQAAHFVASAEGKVLGLRCQTDRAQWLGRLHTPAQPLAALKAVPLVPTALDTGLDPVAVLGVRVLIAPGAQASVTFATAASDDAATLLAVIDKYRQPSYVERSSLMSATLAGIAAQPHRPRVDYLPAMQALTTALVLTLPQAHATPSGSADAGALHSDRRTLWPLGISGDRPLLLVHAGMPKGLGLLCVLALVLREWSRAGVACDVVVLSRELHSYEMPLQRALALLREQHAIDQQAHPIQAATGLHLLRVDELSPEQITTLHSLARVQLQADGQALLHQVRAWCDRFDTAGTHLGNGGVPAHDPVPLRLSETEALPSHGDFLHERSAFAFEAGAGLATPMPWTNVLANPGFGTILSETGAGNTWALNSRLNQLTAWANDPVADPPSEWFLLQDRRTREVWSTAPSAWGAEATRYQVVHSQGLTTIRHQRGSLAVLVSWCVDADNAVKQVRIQLTNHGAGKAHLRLVGLVEWMMGEKRGDRATLLTQPQEGGPPGGDLLGLLCTQTEHAAGFGGGTAFFCEAQAAAGDAGSLDWTCDRSAFFDAGGQLALPQRLGQRSGFGLDPCAALSRPLTLRPGASLEQVFLIGYAGDANAARTLMHQASQVDAGERERAVQARWDSLLGATQVQTPDPLFDALVNRWLLYQTVSSRLWAKAGFYQAGGATGYRDQLQDTMALVWAQPAMLRAQIVLCASRQFEEGDVQHWWHSPGGAGVRTHFSDDLLWLPFATAHYLQATGDTALLDEAVSFLDSPPVPEGSEDRYDSPAISAQQASVYEHGARAIDRSLPVGAHGLPLMGGGDWNDGMNRVGSEGRGESVWLAWFLCRIVSDWLPLARARGELSRVRRWEVAFAGWLEALDTKAWDGAWFKRAFFDDGSPLGSASQPEARIDLIAQAWAVLSDQTSDERQRMAMDAVETQLVDAENGLIRLLDPPLQHASPSAGYIQAYPPGVRENGGQYAHAGVWALMAAAQVALHEHGNTFVRNTPYRYFTYLSPAHRAAHPQWRSAYGLEPYALAADVYSAPPYTGRGGWSWYTGSAGWLHRAALESILGLQLQAEELWFTPCLPAHWPKAEITLRRDGRSMHFVLVRGDPAAELASKPHAQLLQEGERLRWKDLSPDSCLVVPLKG